MRRADLDAGTRLRAIALTGYAEENLKRFFESALKAALENTNAL